MNLRISASHFMVVALLGAFATVAACSSSSPSVNNTTPTTTDGGGDNEGGPAVDGGGGDSTVPNTPEAAACDAYQDAVDALLKKCAPGAVPAMVPADVAVYRRDRDRKFCLAELALPGIAINVQKLNECATVFQNLTCDQVTSTSFKANPALAKCRGSAGSLDDGAPCRTPEQCKGGLCAHAPMGFPQALSTDNSTCNIVGATCHTGVAVGTACNDDMGILCAAGADCVNSVCVANFSVAVGGDCNTNSTGAKGNNCAAGLKCSGSPGKCVTPADLNAVCAGAGSCKSGLVCSMNVCVQGVPLGGTCSSGSNLCIDSFCEPTSQKCVGLASIAKSGDTCGLSSAGIVSCAAGNCLAGKCLNIIPDGASCTIGDKMSTCEYHSQCKDGVCILNSPICK